MESHLNRDVDKLEYIQRIYCQDEKRLEAKLYEEKLKDTGISNLPTFLLGRDMVGVYRYLKDCPI